MDMMLDLEDQLWEEYEKVRWVGKLVGSAPKMTGHGRQTFSHFFGQTFQLHENYGVVLPKFQKFWLLVDRQKDGQVMKEEGIHHQSDHLVCNLSGDDLFSDFSVVVLILSDQEKPFFNMRLQSQFYSWFDFLKRLERNPDLLIFFDLSDLERLSKLDLLSIDFWDTKNFQPRFVEDCIESLHSLEKFGILKQKFFGPGHFQKKSVDILIRSEEKSWT